MMVRIMVGADTNQIDSPNSDVEALLYHFDWFRREIQQHVQRNVRNAFNFYSTCSSNGFNICPTYTIQRKNR